MTSWLPALEWSASTFCVITQLRTFNSCSCRTAACPALGRALLKGLLCVCAARACVRACMHACIHHMSTLTLSLRYVTPNDHAHASTRTHARTHAVTHTHTHTHTYTHTHTHIHTPADHGARPVLLLPFQRAYTCTRKWRHKAHSFAVRAYASEDALVLVCACLRACVRACAIYVHIHVCTYACIYICIYV